MIAFLYFHTFILFNAISFYQQTDLLFSFGQQFDFANVSRFKHFNTESCDEEVMMRGMKAMNVTSPKNVILAVSCLGL